MDADEVIIFFWGFWGEEFVFGGYGVVCEVVFVESGCCGFGDCVEFHSLCLSVVVVWRWVGFCGVLGWWERGFTGIPAFWHSIWIRLIQALVTLCSLAIWVCVLMVLISSAMMLIRGMLVFAWDFRGMVMLFSSHAILTSPTDTPYFLAIFCMLPSLSFTSWAI